MQRVNTIMVVISLLVLTGLVSPAGAGLPVTQGLVLHLDADAITGVEDGAGISRWADLSGMGNDAVQELEPNQPVYMAADPNFFDQPVVHFDGGQFMALPPTTISVGSFTVFAAARFNYTEGNQYIMNGQAGSGDTRVRIAWDNARAEPLFEFRAGTSGWLEISAPADTFIHVFAITSRVEGFLDGLSLGTAGNTSSEQPEAFNIGSYNRGEKDFFDGDLAKFVVYNRVLSSEEIAQVSEYLRIKTSFPRNPKPVDGAVNADRTKALKWIPGEGIESHRVYLGKNKEDVSLATQTNPLGVLVSEHAGPARYDLPAPLDFNEVYYWRVDEVNDLDPNSPWVGQVWRFTTADFVHIDNFEDYNDTESFRVYETWQDGWDVPQNGSYVGYAEPNFANDEHYVETTIVHSGFQSMPYFYDTDNKYSEVVLPLTGWKSDWTVGDVNALSLWFYGHLGDVGSFVESPAGTFTMVGAGTDIFGAADEFHYAYKDVASGTASITVKVDSLDNTDPFAKAGVMVRETLDPGSAYVGVFMTPENGVRFQYRRTTGADTERLFDANVAVPYWVKVESASGGIVRAYYSEDGAAWTRFTIQQIRLARPITMGLAVSSHNTGQAAPAVFSHLTLGSNTSGDWQQEDVGIYSNYAEPLYVAVNGAAVYYEAGEPNATQHGTWTPWTVPLSAFSDQGVDLTQVNTLALGAGIQGDAGTAGGSGLIFIDDIQLTRP